MLLFLAQLATSTPTAHTTTTAVSSGDNIAIIISAILSLIAATIACLPHIGRFFAAMLGDAAKARMSQSDKFLDTLIGTLNTVLANLLSQSTVKSDDILNVCQDITKLENTELLKIQELTGLVQKVGSDREIQFNEIVAVLDRIKDTTDGIAESTRGDGGLRQEIAELKEMVQGLITRYDGGVIQQISELKEIVQALVSRIDNITGDTNGGKRSTQN